LKRCNQCESCRRGYNNICENMFKMRDAESPPGPGGFGEYVVRLGADCYKIAPDVPFEHAALSEPLACVLRSVQRAQLQPGERVVIIGAGIMGMLHLQLARSYNTIVIVSEPEAHRRQKALELGAAYAFNPLEQDYVETVRSLTGGLGASATFVCVAHHATIEPAVVASAQNGRVLCYSSFHPKGKKIEVDPDIFHKKEVTLTGTMSQTREDFFAAAEIISHRLIDLEPLISATYPLYEIEKAVQAALSVDTYRVLVTP
jgi:L-iditol 2-dehydrogenase